MKDDLYNEENPNNIPPREIPSRNDPEKPYPDRAPSTDPEKNQNDTRKHPKSGYDEKNPKSKKDIKNIQDHPENQNTG